MEKKIVDRKIVEALTPEMVEGLHAMVDMGGTLGGDIARGLLTLVREMQDERKPSFLTIHPPTETPPWPPIRTEGSLRIGSDVSVSVLGFVRGWGWHPVVRHLDDDMDPPRYFWEDPTGFFKPSDLRERLACWVEQPSEPAGV